MNKIKKLRAEVNKEIVRLLRKTDLSYDEIAQAAGSTANTVYLKAKQNGLRRQADRKPDGGSKQ